MVEREKVTVPVDEIAEKYFGPTGNYDNVKDMVFALLVHVGDRYAVLKDPLDEHSVEEVWWGLGEWLEMLQRERQLPEDAFRDLPVSSENPPSGG